jgi:hypothetical protein
LELTFFKRSEKKKKKKKKKREREGEREKIVSKQCQNIWVKKIIIKSKKLKYWTEFGTIIVGNECKSDSRKS